MKTPDTKASLRREMHAALEAEIKKLRHGRKLITQADETLLVLAAETLEDTGEAARWLVTAQRNLDGKLPLEAAKTAAGLASVRQILGAIEHGVYL